MSESSVDPTVVESVIQSFNDPETGRSLEDDGSGRRFFSPRPQS